MPVVGPGAEQHQQAPDSWRWPFVATSSRSPAFSAQRPYTALSAGFRGFRSLTWAAVDSRCAPNR
jgi:hypothetical protein